MRAIMNLFKEKRKKRINNQNKKETGRQPVHAEFRIRNENKMSEKEALKQISAKFDLLEEL